MKSALPDNPKISKEAKECMQECVSEFISFVTSEATERCSAERRKTVNGEDILFALMSLGFENYSEVLKIYLAKYRHVSICLNLNPPSLAFVNLFYRARLEKIVNRGPILMTFKKEKKTMILTTPQWFLLKYTARSFKFIRNILLNYYS